MKIKTIPIYHFSGTKGEEKLDHTLWWLDCGETDPSHTLLISVQSTKISAKIWY